MTYYIDIQNMQFNPPLITISRGDTVIWRNKDHMRHSAVRTNKPSFDTGLIALDTESAKISFDQVSGPDGFSYFCGPHRFMLGAIVVI